MGLTCFFIFDSLQIYICKTFREPRNKLANIQSYFGENVTNINNKLYFFPLLSEWGEEAVSKAEILRLIYQGRFLHSNVTLGALGLPLCKTTVMHLVPRENLPEETSISKLNFI